MIETQNLSKEGQQKTSRLEQLLKKILPKNEKESLLSDPKERRDAYRLFLRKNCLIIAKIIFSDNSTLKTTLNDLSAGGFSCASPYPLKIKFGDLVHVDFQLDLDQKYEFTVEGKFISQMVIGSLNSTVYRFQFTENFSDENREIIHKYIFQKQLEWIRGDNEGSH